MFNIFIRSIYKDNFFMIIKSLTISIILAFLPFVLSEFSIVLFKASFIVFLYPLYIFFTGIIRIINYRFHPAFKHLKEFGNPSDEIKKIEEELTYQVKYNGKKVKITPNWIFLCGYNGFFVISTSEVTWVYQRQEHTDVYADPFRIKKRREYDNYNIVIHTKNGYELSTSDHKERYLPDIMKVIFEVSPFAIFGYSKLIKHLWGNSRDIILDAVTINKKFIINGKQPKYTLRSIHEMMDKADEQRSD